MKTESYGRKRHWPGSFHSLAVMLTAALLVLAALAWAQPSQAAPLAGTSIGNQASATYTDASAVVRTATSNTVQTIVQQVAGLTLTATQTKTGAPGGTIYFPHTLTNTGNGSDTFTLATSAGSSFTFANVKIYADANGDGAPDDINTPITSTGPLAAGTSFKFIVAATIPGSATSGQSNTVTVTATSSFNAGSAANNIDTADVSGNAIIAMTKAVSPGSGVINDTLTYTLTYTNTGNATATNVTITDAIPAGLTYKTGDLARWSVTGTTALTDASGDTQGTAPDTIDYKYDSSGTPTITAVIGQVLPGVTRTLTFQVTVNASATPGVINNSAHFTYNDGSTPNKPGDTNTTPFTVIQNAGVVANGSGSSSANGALEPITVATAPQGSTVSFPVYIWNTGNGTDSFDITVPIASSSFPAGTSFLLYKSDGVTPLIDTNTNSTPDTGPLAPGASYKVVVKAILPAGSTSATPVSATLTATSKLDNTKNDTAILTLSQITGSTVDLTLKEARTDSTPAGTAASGNKASTGFGAGPEASAVGAKSANPGATTIFTLKVNNTSPSADTYNLAASTDSTFAATALPTGWSVTYNADGGSGDCATLGSVITNTGVINSAHNATVCAVVTPPSNAAPGAQDIYFRANSPTSGASDPIHCAVDVNTIRSISVTTNQTGQVFPGGTVVYQMTVTNNGNVTEGTVPSSGTPGGSTDSKVTLGISDSLAAQGWTSVVYYDANGDGIIQPTEKVVSDIASISASGILPSQSFPLLVKVFAPSGAATGVTDVATLTATVSGVINTIAAPAASSATDTSTVISGQVTLVKTQALDAACAGATSGTSYNQTNITTGAIPGACILYKITATNVGTAAVSTLVISDATPANTVYNAGAKCPATGGTHGAATTLGTITAPSECAAGTISATIPTLNPGVSVDVTFGVQINQ